MTHNAWNKSLSYNTVFHSRTKNKTLHLGISAPLISTRSSFFACCLYGITDVVLLLSAASFILAPFAPRMSTGQNNLLFRTTMTMIPIITVVYTAARYRRTPRARALGESARQCMAVRPDRARSGSAMLRGARRPGDGSLSLSLSFFSATVAVETPVTPSIRRKGWGRAEMTPSCGNGEKDIGGGRDG